MRSGARMTLLVVVLAVASAAGAHALKLRANAERATWPAEQEYVILPPPEAAPVLSVGYRELLADITWARALVYYGSSRIGESDFRYLTKFIDNVLALDPKFKRVYRWASYAVTFKQERITQDEVKLSLRYLERGMQEFPDDYEMFWLAGMRYWLDLNPDSPAQRREHMERGAELIELAMRKPNAPPDLPTLAATLRTELGQHERALSQLREMILTTDNEQARAKMLQRYEDISGRADLTSELREAQERFDTGWKSTLPFAPPALFVLMGPRPSPVIDFDELATERDLFGADIDLGSDVPELEPVAPLGPEL